MGVLPLQFTEGNNRTNLNLIGSELITVLDIQEGGVDEVIVNAAGTNYEIGDTITFSSGTAEAKVSIVSGAFAPEEGSLDVHVELETGTITGTGSGDLLLETYRHKYL